MAGVWSDDGLANLLDVFLGVVAPAALHLHLFKSNTTVDTDTVLGDLTEADFAGYAVQTLSFPGGSFVASHIATNQADPATFTISAGTQNIYGWYLTDDTDTILITSQRDPAAPVLMDVAGINSYQVTELLRVQDIST